MTFAHLHLILNHLPIVGLPFVLLFYFWSKINKEVKGEKLGLILMILIASTTFLLNETGESVEDLVENIPGVLERVIESHEEAAEVSTVFASILGVLSVLTLWFKNDDKKSKIFTNLVLITALVSVLSFAYTGYLGGKIRHSEFDAKSSVKDLEHD